MRVLRILVLLLAVAAGLLAVALLVFPERVQSQRYERLAQAAFEGSEPTVQLLLWLGADPDGGDYNATSDVEFVTPLGVAASRGNTEVVRLLLESGAAPDGADPTGFTPLVHAASQGHAEVVRLLLDAGARTDTVSMAGTALDVARSARHAEVVALLEAARAESAGSGGVRTGGEPPDAGGEPPDAGGEASAAGSPEAEARAQANPTSPTPADDGAAPEAGSAAP